MGNKRYISFIFVLLMIVEFGCKSSKSLSSHEANLNLNKKQQIRKPTKTCQLNQKNKISLEDFLENFTTIEIGK